MFGKHASIFVEAVLAENRQDGHVCGGVFTNLQLEILTSFFGLFTAKNS